MSDSTRPRLLLIDGHSMAFRAFYALPVENFSTSTGRPTNAVYGFVSMLINVLRSEEPTHIAVAFDVGRVTFRNEMYSEYKGTRDETPEEFKGQVELVQEVLDAMSITYLEKPNFEADDIVATLAARGESEGFDVLICSGDRDTFQLVDDRVTVLYPKKGVSELARMTPQEVETKYGVPPELYPDMAALVGETSDNLPGVPGVGPKTAAKWLTMYGGLQQIAENAEDIGGKVGGSLREHLDQVLLNREVGELIRDVDLGVDVKDLRMGSWDRERIHSVFDALQFRTLRDRLFQAFPDKEKVAEDVEAFSVETTELAPGALKTWLKTHATSTCGLDVEGHVAQGTGEAWRVGIASQSASTSIDLADITKADEKALSAYLADANKSKVIHDSKRAWHALDGSGYELQGVTFDTALAAYLCHPDQRSYDIEDLAIRHLHREIRLDSADDGQEALDLDGESQARQSTMRAYAVIELAGALEKELEDRGALTLLKNVEIPLADLLARMEKAGIAADRRMLTELDDEFASAAEQSAHDAYEAIGHEVNLGSPKQLQEVLFTELKMPKTKKIKTGYTTDADSLAELFAKTGHPFLEHLLTNRDVTKLRQTVQGLIKSIADDGRIHTTFQQTMAATGRLSSTDPNLQNIPARTDAGRRIRDALVVGDGYEELLTADYSQIEMRIMAHLSGDEGLIDAFRSGEDLHSYVGSQVFNVPADDVTSAMRTRVKAMSYGLAYGLSAYGLSRQLGITPDEARGLMDDYFERFGGVSDYLHAVVEQARGTGYTETIMGRRRYLPDLTSDNRQRREMAERMALNAPIQGSAADVMKVAMLRIDDDLTQRDMASRLLLQIHDEVIIEVAPGERDTVERIVRDRMGTAVDLSVPLEVSIGVGRSWLEAAH